jgi:hypothetical protein
VAVVRPLLPSTHRTLQLFHAYDLAVSTIPDLEDGEAVELDATHGGESFRCVVRRVGDAFDVIGVRLHVKGLTVRGAGQGFSGLWLAVEEDAPDLTHATVRRYSGERT